MFVCVHAPVVVVVVVVVIVHSNMVVDCVVDIDVCITTDMQLTCYQKSFKFLAQSDEAGAQHPLT